MPPKATAKATSKGKTQSITNFFQRKSKTETKDEDDDFQETKVVIPEKSKIQPKPKAAESKVQAKPKSTTSSSTIPAKRNKKLIHISDSESDYDDNKEEPEGDTEEEEEEDEDDYEEEEEEEEVKPKKKAIPKKTVEPAIKKKPAAVKKQDTDDKPAPSAKAKSFRDMLNRAPPKSLGSRPEPVGAPNCLANLTFVFSGQFDTLTKEQVKDIIMRYGGRLTGSVSGKTNYLLRGRDAGESKTQKAKELRKPILGEDEFYNLIESAKEKEEVIPDVPKSVVAAAAKMASTTNKGKKRAAEEDEDKVSSTKMEPPSDSLLWVDKYKPVSLKDVVGNKEMVNRISTWVADWKSNYDKGFPGQATDLSSKRALLISGPPGIGKSTTAGLAAKENGFEAIEFNASDVRSKKILENSLSEMIDNRSMTEFFQASSSGERNAKRQKTSSNSENPIRSKKVLLIMDEVDGMSSGDRGGAVELASLIKKTKIPVICICNDVRSQKVAPLLKVCADVRFRRTPANQIRSRIMTIAYKEGLKIQPNAIDELVLATQNDIRQIINILSTYRLSRANMNYDEAKKVGKSNQKNSQIGLFEIPGALLSSGGWREKSLEEKSEIYFYEYDRADMMIAENYLKSTPALASSMCKTGNRNEIDCNEMDLLAKASEAIAEGDYISAQIHGTVQQYSLMPVHSIMSCVRPAKFAHGQMKGRIDFPAWLGQNSKTNKYTKLLNDIQARMSRNSSADNHETREYYIPVLSARIFNALEKEDYDTAIKIMDEYELDRENVDTISELQLPSSTKGPITKLPTSVKSTFTRKYNSQHHDTIFHDGGAAIKKTVSGPKEDLVGTIVAEEDPEVSDEDAEEDELEDLKKSKDLKVITRKKGAAATSAGKKRKATAGASSAAKKKSKK